MNSNDYKRYFETLGNHTLVLELWESDSSIKIRQCFRWHGKTSNVLTMLI